MFYSCYQPVTYACEECHEKVYPECTSLSFQAGLSGNTQYFVHIIDKFYNHYVQKKTTNGSGTVTINTDGLPENFFNKYAGEIEIKLSLTLNGSFVDLIMDGVAKKCLIIVIQ